MKLLITGAAGFIGHAVSTRLLSQGHDVFGIDNMNAYYETRLKDARLAELVSHPKFHFEKLDISDSEALLGLFRAHRPERVIHLAAQAGVRHSLNAPHDYIAANVTGFLNVLEACRHCPVEHLVFASSSSVYGANRAMPFSTHHHADHPISLYGATKKAGEMMAHSYSHLFGIPMTGLRFFTVYGPWGRPDMAYFKFARAIMSGETIDVYNHGEMERDFTYIDDIVDGIMRVLAQTPQQLAQEEDAPPDASRVAPYRLYNIGNHTPVKLLDMIAVLEKNLGRQAKKNLLPMQPGDVRATFADVESLMRDTGFTPHTPIEEGLARFVEWFRRYEAAG